MNREQMLDKLGLTEDELKDLMVKFAVFFNSLNAQQKNVINTSMPGFEEIASSFGPDVTPEHLKTLCDLENICIGVAFFAFKAQP